MCPSKLVESRVQIVVQSDSPAALSVALKLSSPKVLMNSLAAEIALVLDELRAELILTQHIQGVLRFEADALCRLLQGASIPASLVIATCLPLSKRWCMSQRSKRVVGHLCRHTAWRCLSFLRLFVKENTFVSVGEDRLQSPETWFKIAHGSCHVRTASHVMMGEMTAGIWAQIPYRHSHFVIDTLRATASLAKLLSLVVVVDSGAECLLWYGTSEHLAAQAAAYAKNFSLHYATSDSKFKQSWTKAPCATTSLSWKKHVKSSVDQTGERR